MNRVPLSVVIVSYRRALDLKCVLRDLEQQQDDSFEVVLVLQAYSQYEITEVTENLKLRSLNLITLKDPAGVHGSRNIALKYVAGELVAFLDDDCRIKSDWTLELKNLFRAGGQIGGAGGYVRHPDRPRTRWSWLVKLCGAEPERYQIDWGGMHSSPTDRFPSGEMDADWLSGGNMCFRSKVMLEVGNFDESYGNYGFDDADYCLRVRRLGYKLLVSDSVTVDHFPSKSARPNFAENFSQEEIRRVMFARKALAGKRLWKVRYSIRYLRRLPLVVAVSIRRQSIEIVLRAIQSTYYELKKE